MPIYTFLTFVLVITSTVAAADGYDMKVGGETWLHTVTSPHDASSDETRAETYKVYTQVYDFDGDRFLTKGAGGKYPHHRGLFIGWKDTLVDGTDYDTWHMSNCYQEHVEWIYRKNGEDGAMQSEVIEWRNLDDAAFLREVRTISAHADENGRRIIDFSSELRALDKAVALKGDLQHAGMQVRMANEVSEHEDNTEYTLPDGATLNQDDEVIGAWWALGRFEVDGERVWVLHMTPPDHATGVPVYSIRAYGRFGAFWETEIPAGGLHETTFRVVVSRDEITKSDAEALYADYSEYSKRFDYLNVE